MCRVDCGTGGRHQFFRNLCEIWCRMFFLSKTIFNMSSWHILAPQARKCVGSITVPVVDTNFFEICAKFGVECFFGWKTIFYDDVLFHLGAYWRRRHANVSRHLAPHYGTINIFGIWCVYAPTPPQENRPLQIRLKNTHYPSTAQGSAPIYGLEAFAYFNSLFKLSAYLSY